MSCAICGADLKDHGDKPHDYDSRADALARDAELMVKLRDKPATVKQRADSKPPRKRISVGGVPVMLQSRYGGWAIERYYSLTTDDMRRLRAALDQAISMEEDECKDVTVSTVDEG